MERFWKDGQVVLFQGDSITDCGRNREDEKSLGNGYANKIVEIYNNLFPEHKVTFINKAISGDRSKDLLDRYEKDIRDIRPDFISIMIGINDVWRKFDSNDPTSTEQFKANYRKVLSSIKRECPDTKIMILEPYVLDTLEDRKQWYDTLDPIIRAVRDLAQEYADYYLPVEGILHSYISKGIQKEKIAADGVHPTQTGHGIIAYEYMKLLNIL
ncbi:MAG TPA: SGNH/GDSL hydrolase family protein [Clostridiales bacterium]|nr:SGNH/GDSL hydrolase family protein [Clostridiales bacterium]